MTLGMWIATAAWLSLLLAYRFRATTRLHVFFAYVGILSDLSLVLYLQLTRSAVQTAISFRLDALEQTHILLSTLAVLCYIPTICFGLLLLFYRSSSRRLLLHKTFAVSALVLRTLGFLFMFSMWKA